MTLLLHERDDRGVVTLTLNRPQAFNALSEDMLTALGDTISVLAQDDSVRAVVLGASGKAFCAGHDLKEMRAEPSLEYYQRLFAQCTAVMLSIQRLPVPVIARVHGLATAAGCQLVAMCDLAVASHDARFAVSGVNVGLFCATPAVALSRNVPRKSAFEMLVTGEFISSSTGTRAGSGQQGRRAGGARRRDRGDGREHRRQAGGRRCHGKGVVLPAAQGRYRGGLRRRRCHHGLQHDGSERT